MRWSFSSFNTIILAGILVFGLIILSAIRKRKIRKKGEKYSEQDENTFVNSIFCADNVIGIANPISGSKNSLAYWEMLFGSEGEYEGMFQTKLYKTTCEGHGREIGRQIKNRRSSTVIIVGGDGLVSEVVNGLFSNDTNDSCCLSVVPAGTGNGLARSLGIRSLDDVVSALDSGKTCQVNLIEVNSFKLEQAVLCKAVLSVAFGAIADFDALAEREFRIFGHLAASIIPLYLIMRNRHYSANLWWRSDLGAEKQFIKGPFWLIHCCNVAWISDKVNMAPGATPDDGLMHIVVMLKTSRWEALNMFLAAEQGTHLNQKNVLFLRAMEFGIEPAECGGVFVVDGNLLEGATGPVTAKVLQKTATFYHNM